MLIASLISLTTQAQEKKEAPKFGISFSGFVKTDIFYDTRQAINIREGHFLLYPENVLPDANSRDINAKPAFNILSIQSRLRGAITGPNAFGAKTSGVLEADFFGNAGPGLDDVNGFRLRHAFVKLNWTTTELLVGQYWSPMFVAEMFPAVISFNTGAPFQPFTRNPQIRVSKTMGGLKVFGVLYAQRDFTSIGPEYSLVAGKYSAAAVSSSKFMRNAGIPNAHLQFQFTPASTEHLFGAGVDIKTIKPETFTVDSSRTKRFETSEKLSSLSYIAYARVKLKPVTFKLQGILAQNATDLVMIGGYTSEITDLATGNKQFNNITTGSVWFEAHTNGQNVQFGLFTGYTENLGTTDDISSTASFYARGANIDNVYRIAPRIEFISGKLNIALEIEHTVASYGKQNGDLKGGVTDGEAVANTRGLVAFIFKF